MNQDNAEVAEVRREEDERGTVTQRSQRKEWRREERRRAEKSGEEKGWVDCIIG